MDTNSVSDAGTSRRKILLGGWGRRRRSSHAGRGRNRAGPRTIPCQQPQPRTADHEHDHDQ